MKLGFTEHGISFSIALADGLNEPVGPERVDHAVSLDRIPTRGLALCAPAGAVAPTSAARRAAASSSGPLLSISTSWQPAGTSKACAARARRAAMAASDSRPR